MVINTLRLRVILRAHLGFTSGGRSVWFCTSKGINPTTQNTKNKMIASILSSDRYIAIKGATGLTFNKTLRILTRDTNGSEVIVPCRWNQTNKRLESVALNEGPQRPFMYEASNRLISKLKAAGYLFELLNASEAEALTT